MLRGLIERGLRRVLVVVRDDFDGLLPITKGLFSKADDPALQRLLAAEREEPSPKPTHPSWPNACGPLRPRGAGRSPARVRDACQRFQLAYSSFIAELRKKREHYLAFLKYLDSVRRSFPTTNLLEVVIGQLEIMRRNSGGYFQSEDALKLKLGMAVSQLEAGTWPRIATLIDAALHQVNAMLESPFESAM